MRLNNKVAIITGGSSGIGAAIAETYANEGATVIIVNKNNPQNAANLENKIKQNNGKAKAFICDISNKIEVEQLVKEVSNQFGRIDILVNSAGTLVFKSFEDHTLDDWDTTINVNLKGTFLISQAVVPHMKKQRDGKIIFISSLAAIRGVGQASAYSASKGGILALAKSMVAELASYQINVNLITPGFTATPMNQALRNDPNFKQQIKPAPSGNYVMEPEELAEAAVFLACDESKHVHGLDLIVDGGASAVQ